MENPATGKPALGLLSPSPSPSLFLSPLSMLLTPESLRPEQAMFQSEDFNSDRVLCSGNAQRGLEGEGGGCSVCWGGGWGLSSAWTGGELAGTHGLTQRVLGSLSHSVKQCPALAMCHINVLLNYCNLS